MTPLTDYEKLMKVPHVCGFDCTLLPSDHMIVDRPEPTRSDDIDAYGDYTVQRWFSAGDEAVREAENVRERGAGKSLGTHLQVLQSATERSPRRQCRETRKPFRPWDESWERR